MGSTAEKPAEIAAAAVQLLAASAVQLLAAAAVQLRDFGRQVGMPSSCFVYRRILLS